MNTPVNRATLDKLRNQITAFQLEMQNLNMIAGLPVDFWKIVKKRSFEMIPLLLQIDDSTLPHELAAYIQDVGTLYAQCRFEEVVSVDFNGLPSQLRQAALDRLLRLAPGAKLYHITQGDKESATLGPVKKLTANSSAISM